MGCDKNRRKYIEGGVRVCGDAVLQKCRNVYFKSRYYGFENQGFVVFKNFQVISMRFAIFLCYSVQFF